MINCIIVEDQPPAQRILKNYIAQFDYLNLVATFPDANKAIDLMKVESVDLIFLDIHLPKMSGIDFLRSLVKQPKIILTTAFSEYAIESYEFNVVDYLLKPISRERFEKAIIKLNTILDNEKAHLNKETITIKSGYEHIKLDVDDIIYIKSDADYTEVYTSSKVYLNSDTLKQWLEKLDICFCQIHKSFILNINHLKKVSSNKAYLSTDGILPIGRTFKKSLIDKL